MDNLEAAMWEKRRAQEEGYEGYKGDWREMAPVVWLVAAVVGAAGIVVGVFGGMIWVWRG